MLNAHTLLILTIQEGTADPTLVINLLTSSPGTTETGIIFDDDGRTSTTAVWDSQDTAHQVEWRRALQKLDNFMSEVIHTIVRISSLLAYVQHLAMPTHLHAPSSSQVIIPKANESNAIVITDGLKGGCLLSDSFNRVMTLQVTISAPFRHFTLSHCRLRKPRAQTCRRTSRAASRRRLPSSPSSPVSKNKKVPTYIRE